MQSEVSHAVESSAYRQQLGPTLRSLRVQHGWSITELARRSGVSRSQLTRLELGRSVPSFVTLDRLAVALDVSFNYLISAERAATEMLDDFQSQLVSLAIPPNCWREFLALSLEARGALLDALKRLNAPKEAAASARRALEAAILTRNLSELGDMLRQAVSSLGLRPNIACGRGCGLKRCRVSGWPWLSACR
ncbi:MAG TPA: helix-turn-helix transcriptional regulator [Thermomicrobiaceae bacterium]|nr:helix-turn-helix transcriptional regulator [Thermomicrobiaceae bacterium]